MARIIDWKQAEDSRDIVHVAVQALAESQLIVVPAETTYLLLASGLHPEAVRRLGQASSELALGKPKLLLRSLEELRDYLPKISPVAERIARRAWPGPVTLKIPIDHSDSLAQQLPLPTRALCFDAWNQLDFRAAAHESIRNILRLFPGPLLGVTLNDRQGSPVTQGKQAVQIAGKLAAVVLDDGTTHFQQPSAVIQVDGNQCHLHPGGFLSAKDAQSLGQMVILLVCTGNTCRSPMAQVMLQHRLRERFSEEFSNSEVPPAIAISAGTSAGVGGPASHEAIVAMGRRGLDLEAHQSRAVSARMVEHADLILTMTQNHRQAVLSRWPQFTNKVHVLSLDGGDVADPYGGSQDVYWAASQQIDQQLGLWMKRIDQRSLPVWRAEPLGSDAAV